MVSGLDIESQNRQNNFDLLRLFAATQVAFLHVAKNLDVELTSVLMVLKRGMEYFPGVPIFFVISGFLISASLDRNPDLRNYAVNRVLRIFPALWVSTLVTLLLLVAFGHQVWEVLDQSGQRASPVVAKWLIAQFSFAQFYNPYVIKANYGVGHLNGSLWTIPVELQFYMILPLLAPLLWRGISKATANARLMVATATLFAVSWLFKTYSGDLSVFSENLAILARVTVLPYLYMFVLGILLQRNKKEWSPFLEGKGVYWLLIYVLAASALKYVLAIPEGTNTPNLFSMTLLAVTVVSLAFTRRGLSEQTLRGNDISYGTYVYHMVVANLAFQLGYSRTVPVLAAVLVASFGLAILSWFLVEKPALGLKRSALLVRGARATNRA